MRPITARGPRDQAAGANDMEGDAVAAVLPSPEFRLVTISDGRAMPLLVRLRYPTYIPRYCNRGATAP